MPHDKRNCRKSSREPGLATMKNYHSDRAMQRALRRQQMAKVSRRINRRRK